MDEQTKEKAIHAIITREYQRVDRVMDQFLNRASIPPESAHLMRFVKEWAFQRGFPTLLKDAMKDSVGSHLLATQLSKLLSFAQFVGGDRILKSDLGDLLRARFPHLDDGLEIPGSYDSGGNPVRITAKGMVEDVRSIIEEVAEFLKVSAKYIGGFAEAYENRAGAMAIDDLVEEREAEMFALLKTFAKGKPVGKEALLESYHRFTQRFVTNGEPAEYSFLLKKPFDFLIQMGRYAFELVGNEDSFMGIIEFATMTPATKPYVKEILKRTEVTEELRKLVYSNKNEFLDPLIQTLTGLKEVTDFAGQELYRHQLGVIDQFSGIKEQRSLLIKYGKLMPEL